MFLIIVLVLFMLVSFLVLAAIVDWYVCYGACRDRENWEECLRECQCRKGMKT